MKNQDTDTYGCLSLGKVAAALVDVFRASEGRNTVREITRISRLTTYAHHLCRNMRAMESPVKKLLMA